jgi:hypothetical protein
MKNYIILSVAALALVCTGPAVVHAQQHTNFSGTWKLTKREPPPRAPRREQAAEDGENRGSTRALDVPPVTLTITQNGDDMTFESTMSDGWVRTLKFNLKFEYTVNPLPPGGDGGEPRLNGPTKTRGRWMGERLFLHLTQGLGQRRDILSLDGNVLSIQRDYETPGGAGTMYLTFNKVS